MPNNSPVIRRKGDPNIYLYVNGDWYGYNPDAAPLGGGAMGTVWQGYKIFFKNNQIIPDKKIAIKRVNEKYQNIQSIRQRAFSEASMAFLHPNLIEMIGCCMLYPDKGPIWLLSNFVYGQEIDKYIKTIPDGESKVIFISKAMCQVLDALDYIHRRGIMHRDIKPSNIMVEDGANVRLMDLGIARVCGSNHLTNTGGFVGTPQYAAPEQIACQEVNETSDIYALGVSFYELLTGNNPFEDESEDESGETDNDVIFKKHMTMVLPKDERIPKKLYKVLLKATDASQSKRYQTAMEFQAAIKAATITRSMWEKFIDLFSK